MADVPQNRDDDLDDFFEAVDASQPSAMRKAANRISDPNHRSARANTARFEREESGSVTRIFQELATAVNDDGAQQDEGATVEAESPLPSPRPKPITPSLPEQIFTDEAMEGKFIAIEPLPVQDEDAVPDHHFVLVPAYIHQYVPWWGWVTIALGLVMLMAGVVLMPVVNLDRLTSRLSDPNEAKARMAMQQLVLRGNERTVKKLYDVATAENQGMAARLRAIDTMSLIERVPEVDNALLRLELSSQVNHQVREAATAARKQREAYKTRGKKR